MMILMFCKKMQACFACIVVVHAKQYFAWVPRGRSLAIAGGVHPMTYAPSYFTPMKS